MKKTITTIIFFIAFYQFSKAQTFTWASQLSLDDYNIVNSLKVDAAGNSYVSGHYYITGSAGPPSGTSGAFIAQYNSSGTLVWRDTIKDSDEGGSRIDLDASGNVYFSTFITGTHMVGGSSVTSTGMKDILIVKYNSGGVKQWHKTAGGPANDAGQGVAVDAAGNVYVTGYFGGTASFDGTMKTAVGYSDIFVAKYTAAGTLVWVQTASGDGDITSGVGFDQTLDLALDNTGNPVVGGYFLGAGTFGTSSFTSAGTSSGFIAKLDALGNWTWVKQLQVTPQALDFDNSGSGYMTGSFSGSVTLGSVNLSSTGDTDIYLAKFDAAGDIIWAKKSGGTEEDRGYDVAVDLSGNPYIALSFFGNTVIGDSSLVVMGEENSAVAKYDAAGNFMWAKQIKANTGAFEFITAHAIDISNTGDAHVGGSFFGAAIFDAISLTATVSTDAFVAKLSTAIATGVVEADATSEFSVYSQNNMVTVSYSSKEEINVQVQLLNVSGQVIYSVKSLRMQGNGTTTISLPESAKGIYLLNIISKENTTTKRFVLQ
ncbi:MAG: T9SS type A sorting domain-containing protein [Bacteroidota bacterium]|nr:T9SS type A sorting domain-containing protein [Bacteroidota bacterium]